MNRAYGPIIDCLTVRQLLKMRKPRESRGWKSGSSRWGLLSATWRTRRPLCTDEIFNLARAAPNVCVLNLHGNLSILTENGQCKCLPGQMNGRERRPKQQQQATAAVPPSSLFYPAPNWSVNGRRALHPALCESLMSLWAFLIRVCICVCQMLSVERQRLAPQLHVQHAHRPPLPPTYPFLSSLSTVSIAASGSAMDPDGPMGDCCYR